MKKYTIFGSGMDMVLTEAEVVRLGFKHAGVIGLVESISAFENADIAIVPETSGDDEEDEEEIAMNEGLGDFLKDSLSKLKGGKISDDDFDKYYAEKVASGDVNPSNMARKFIKNREMSAPSETSIRGVSMGKSPSFSRRLDFDKKVDMADKKVAPISTEDRSKKVDNYRKMFRMDMGKFKKIFEIAPELVDEFKSFIDGMVANRDKQFASLSEAEAAPATAVTQAPKATAPAQSAAPQPAQATAPAQSAAPQPAQARPSFQDNTPASQQVLADITKNVNLVKKPTVQATKTAEDVKKLGAKAQQTVDAANQKIQQQKQAPAPVAPAPQPAPKPVQQVPAQPAPAQQAPANPDDKWV